jgi:hypothetical protein
MNNFGRVTTFTFPGAETYDINQLFHLIKAAPIDPPPVKRVYDDAFREHARAHGFFHRWTHDNSVEVFADRQGDKALYATFSPARSAWEWKQARVQDLERAVGNYYVTNYSRHDASRVNAEICKRLGVFHALPLAVHGNAYHVLSRYADAWDRFIDDATAILGTPKIQTFAVADDDPFTVSSIETSINTLLTDRLTLAQERVKNAKTSRAVQGAIDDVTKVETEIKQHLDLLATRASKFRDMLATVNVEFQRAAILLDCDL